MRKPVTFSIEEDIMDEFARVSKLHAINRSQFIENIMVETLKIMKDELTLPIDVDKQYRLVKK